MDEDEYVAGCETYNLSMMEFEIVPEQEVHPAKILFCGDDRRYIHVWGKLTLAWDHFYIGWRSEGITPEMQKFGADSFAIGVDENYAVFTKQLLTVGVSNSPLLSMYVLDNILAIRFEMEIHIYKAGRPEMWCNFGLPDISEDLELTATSIAVKCMDDYKIYKFDFPVLE